MAETRRNRLKLFDAFEVLTWADIVEASSEKGHPVQVQGPGYEPARVKVRTNQQLIWDVKTKQLKLGERSLAFIGQYVSLALIKLEIRAPMFVQVRPELLAPNAKQIHVPKDEYEQIRCAIASDIEKASHSGLNELSRYLRLLVEFCNCWNAGNAEGLTDAVRKLRSHEAGRYLGLISARLYRCLSSFQDFYLSQKNFPAAYELLEKATGTPVQRGMEKKLASMVSRLVSALLDDNQLKRAAEFAEMIPNTLWKEATLDKIKRLTKKLSRTLDNEFCEAIDQSDIEAARNCIGVARREAITKLDSIDVDRLDDWLYALLKYPRSGVEQTVTDLDSHYLVGRSPRKIKAMFTKRAAEEISEMFASSDFGKAVEAAQVAIAGTNLIEKGSCEWKWLRARLFDHLVATENKVNIVAAKNLFPIFDINVACVKEIVAKRLAKFEKMLTRRDTEPKDSLTILSGIEPLSDFIPDHYPYSKLGSFLQDSASGRLRHAYATAEDLALSDIPTEPVLAQATRLAAERTSELLERDDYFGAKTYYLDNILGFRKHPSIRASLISDFSKCRRKRELAFFRAEIDATYRSICSKTYGFEYNQPELTRQDYEVIAAWNNVPSDELGKDPFSFLSQRLKEYRLMQHISARSSERVALKIYKKMYGDVNDISSEQVEGASRDWVYADLLARSQNHSDRYIDVKSARASFSRENRFSEFCLKKFKKVDQGIDVDLSAFFSDYKTLSQFSEGDTPTYQWIGEFSKGQVIRSIGFIHKNFKTMFLLEDFRRNIESTKFIPGWLFDYPEVIYKPRNGHIRALSSLMDRAHCREAVPADLPDSLQIFVDKDIPRDRSRSEKLVVNALRAMMDEHGLDRGLLFMTIIAVSLTAMWRGWMEFRPVIFREFIDLDDSDDSRLRPLGIWDPLGYIDELIESLDTVFRYSRERMLGFRTFRLVGHGILMGRSAHDEHWTTILAYCGGRKQKLNVRCGNTPLVLGVEENCPACGKLVCNECGYCSERCENCYSHELNDDIPRETDGGGTPCDPGDSVIDISF